MGGAGFHSRLTRRSHFCEGTVLSLRRASATSAFGNDRNCDIRGITCDEIVEGQAVVAVLVVHVLECQSVH